MSHSYFPDGGHHSQQGRRQDGNGPSQPRHVPAVTVTPASNAVSPIEEPALRRPLNLGIATAAANSAARSAAAAAQRPPIQQQQQQQVLPQQSRVQQKLQRANSPANASGLVPMHTQGNPSRPPQVQQQHVPPFSNSQQQQQEQRGTPAPRQAGPNGMRPFELRGNAPPPQQQFSAGNNPPSRRPDLQVAVPRRAHQPPRSQQRPQHQQQNVAPFSSSSDTLVGSYDQHKYGSSPPKWSPASSSSSSSHTHGHSIPPSTPTAPFAAGHPNSPYGHPPSSPSIKNLQLQVPTRERAADSENDRLSPAMARGGPNGGNQRDWWKRFSTVVRENEEREKLAEKTGGKAPKAQSEWLDAQVHRQRKYRIWVGVVAFVILAAIGGGLAYHFVTKDKDSENAVTVPTTHGIELTSSNSATLPSSVAATSVTLAAPSAVQPGNIIGARDHIMVERGASLAQPAQLLAARSLGAHKHARRSQHLHQLD